jgi:hypothetical protein
MLMIYGGQRAWNALDQNDFDRIGQCHKALQRELAATRELVDHKELALDEAVVVRVNRGDTVVSSGPLTDGDRILGGYYLVDCAGHERAVQIASRFAEAEFAPIEVRRLSGDSSWDAGGPSTKREPDQ